MTSLSSYKLEEMKENILDEVKNIEITKHQWDHLLMTLRLTENNNDQ